MSGRKLYAAISNIDDDLIESALHVKKSVPVWRYASLAACFALVAVLAWFTPFQSPQTAVDLTDRIVVQEFSGAPTPFDPPVSDVAVNLEGTITEVGRDGLSFRLDHGPWVQITDDTLIGPVCTSTEQKESLFIEPTLRVGNLISGFTEDATTDPILAYAIYTNWNFEQPVRE